MTNPAYAQAFNRLGHSYDAELAEAATELARVRTEALRARNEVIREAEETYARVIAQAEDDHRRARGTARRRFFSARPALPAVRLSLIPNCSASEPAEPYGVRAELAELARLNGGA